MSRRKNNIMKLMIKSASNGWWTRPGMEDEADETFAEAIELLFRESFVAERKDGDHDSGVVPFYGEGKAGNLLRSTMINYMQYGILNPPKEKISELYPGMEVFTAAMYFLENGNVSLDMAKKATRLMELGLAIKNGKTSASFGGEEVSIFNDDPMKMLEEILGREPYFEYKFEYDENSDIVTGPNTQKSEEKDFKVRYNFDNIDNSKDLSSFKGEVNERHPLLGVDMKLLNKHTDQRNMNEKLDFENYYSTFNEDEDSDDDDDYWV